MRHSSIPNFLLPISSISCRIIRVRYDMTSCVSSRGQCVVHVSCLTRCCVCHDVCCVDWAQDTPSTELYDYFWSILSFFLDALISDKVGLAVMLMLMPHAHTHAHAHAHAHTASYSCIMRHAISPMPIGTRTQLRADPADHTMHQTG